MYEKNKKIVFAGTPEFSSQLMSFLINKKINIDLVITKVDKASGRGMKINYSPVKKLAIKNNLPFIQPKNCGDSEFIEAIKKIKPDILIVVAFGLILTKDVLDIFSKTCINVHTSLLPKWRGAAPIQRAILNGDKVTGVSIMKMEEKLDSGNIYAQKKIAIQKDDTTSSLLAKMLRISGPLLFDVINNLDQKINKSIKQNEEMATYAKKIEKSEAKLDWTEPGNCIVKKINAFNPYPGSFAFFKKKKIKIWRASFIKLSETELHVGTVKILNKKEMHIRCKDGFIKVLELQMEGQRKMEISKFLLSNLKIDFLS